MQKFFVIAVAICLTWSRIDAACTDAASCSDQGTCDPSTGDGVCTCSAGFTGLNCELDCPAKCATGECTFSGSAPSCGGSCMTNFEGDACNACVAGKVGTECDQDCPLNCAAAADCSLNAGAPSCGGSCKTGFTGDACDTCKTGFTGDACDSCVADKAGENCDLDCPAGDAACTGTKKCGWLPGDAAASCVCSDTTKVGDNCDIACPSGTDLCESPQICVATSTTESACGCGPTLFGDACADKKCTESGDEACKNEGTCQADFTCECAAGFEGDRCDEAKEEEPEEENGAGMVAASLMALTLSATGALLL